MSLFGYPATIIHQEALLDSWKRVMGYTPQQKNAKVVEEQKEIKNGLGEEVISIAEIHLEGYHNVSSQDYFDYLNPLGTITRYDVRHIEVKKQLGTDEVKKMIVYA